MWRGAPGSLASARFDQLDRQSVEIFDHERARIAEAMRRLENLHAISAELGVERVEILNAERDMIEDLAARRHELLIAAAPSADALARIPRHGTVPESHRAGRLPNRSNGLERWPTGVPCRHRARIPRGAR